MKQPDTVNLYASATRGFKSGGFNLLAVQPGFDPETLWAYEAGIRAQTPDRRLTVNGNFFYHDYKNMQVGQIVNLQSVLTNAAKSRLYGAELEVSARPVDGLDLGFTAAWLNARYQQFCTRRSDQTKCACGVPGCNAANPIDLSGNALPRAPEWTLTGTAGYTVDLGASGGLNFRTDLRYQSEIFFTQFNRPLISQGGFMTANAAVTWTSENDRYTVGAFVNNLTNKTFFTEVLESGAFNPQLVAASLCRAAPHLRAARRGQVLRSACHGLSDAQRWLPVVVQRRGQRPDAGDAPGPAISQRLFRQKVMAPLAERNRVIAIDLRGQGLSGKSIGGHSIAGNADDLAEALAILGVKDALLLGRLRRHGRAHVSPAARRRTAARSVPERDDGAADQRRGLGAPDIWRFRCRSRGRVSLPVSVPIELQRWADF